MKLKKGLPSWIWQDSNNTSSLNFFCPCVAEAWFVAAAVSTARLVWLD
jgi:hypothetical protein